MASCDKPRRVGDQWDRGSPQWASGGVAPAKSQVIFISHLQAIRYTLEKLFLHDLKKNGSKASLMSSRRNEKSIQTLRVGYDPMIDYWLGK